MLMEWLNTYKLCIIITTVQCIFSVWAKYYKSCLLYIFFTFYSSVHVHLTRVNCVPVAYQKEVLWQIGGMQINVMIHIFVNNAIKDHTLP